MRAGGVADRAAPSQHVLLAERVAVVAVLLAGWWLGAKLFDDRWTSDPVAVATRLVQWGADDLWAHVATTLYEMAAGLAIGVPCGALVGLWLGWSPAVARAARPLVVAANSVPVVALAPLLIMWLGLGLDAEDRAGRAGQLLPRVLQRLPGRDRAAARVDRRRATDGRATARAVHEDRAARDRWRGSSPGCATRCPTR